MFGGQDDEKEYPKETDEEWTVNWEMTECLEAELGTIFKKKRSD